MVISKKKCMLADLKASPSKLKSTKCTSCQRPSTTYGKYWGHGTYVLTRANFNKYLQEQKLYTRNNEVETLIVGVYVDDLIIIDTSVEDIKEFNQQMMKEFAMTDLGLLTYYLGIEVDQRKNCIMLKQSTMLRRCCISLRWQSATWPSILSKQSYNLGKMLKKAWWIPLSIAVSSEVWGTWLILVWTFHMLFEWLVGTGWSIKEGEVLKNWSILPIVT